jgi:hypothetical protein
MIALLITDEKVDPVVNGRRRRFATALQLACTGDRVVVLDRAFRSDTLSTHVPFPGGVVELPRVGAHERALALGAPRGISLMIRAASREERTGLAMRAGAESPAMRCSSPTALLTGAHQLRDLGRT